MMGVEPLPHRHAALRRASTSTASLKLDEMISARLPLEQINDAFDKMKSGEVARSVIVMGNA